MKRKRVSLEHIFGSRVRVRLLKLFLERPDDKYYVREITRYTRSHIYSVRRELANLVRVGVLRVFEEEGARPRRRLSKKFYAANPNNIIFDELRTLIRKGQLFLQDEFARQLAEAGSLKYLALTGFFTDLQGFPTDVMIVGRVSKKRCLKIMQDFEDEFGRTINYTVLPFKEFTERKEMTDRFLYNFFEAKKVVLIDKLPVSTRMGI